MHYAFYYGILAVILFLVTAVITATESYCVLFRFIALNLYTVT